jgi:hypothetical protein
MSLQRKTIQKLSLPSSGMDDEEDRIIYETLEFSCTYNDVPDC